MVWTSELLKSEKSLQGAGAREESPRPPSLKFLTVYEVRALLQRKFGRSISCRSIYNWVAGGYVIAVRLGRTILIPLSEVGDILERCIKGEPIVSRPRLTHEPQSSLHQQKLVEREIAKYAGPSRLPAKAASTAPASAPEPAVRVLSTSEARHLLEQRFGRPICYGTLWRWIKTGRLPAVRRGGRYYVPLPDLDAFCNLPREGTPFDPP